jgi:hypothetical protein
MQRCPRTNLTWKDLNNDFDNDEASKWMFQANYLPENQNNIIKAKAHADGIDVLPSHLVAIRLEKWRASAIDRISTGGDASPLRSLGDGVLRDLSTPMQGEYFCPFSTK